MYCTVLYTCLVLLYFCCAGPWASEAAKGTSKELRVTSQCITVRTSRALTERKKCYMHAPALQVTALLTPPLPSPPLPCTDTTQNT